MNKIDLLIKILLDKNDTISERDDAAMDLSEYDNELALDALIKVASDNDEDEMILNSCGESIASIWIKRNVFDEKIYYLLSMTARFGIFDFIESQKPEWIMKFNL